MGSLDELKVSNYHLKVLKKEIENRYVRFINSNRIDKTTLDELVNLHTILMICNFSFFEALYYIFGRDIVQNTLLSEDTLKFLRNHIREDDLNLIFDQENGIDKLDQKIHNIIRELDEIILISKLRRDSDRFKQIYARIVSMTGTDNEIWNSR